MLRAAALGAGHAAAPPGEALRLLPSLPLPWPLLPPPESASPASSSPSALVDSASQEDPAAGANEGRGARAASAPVGPVVVFDEIEEARRDFMTTARRGLGGG